MPHDLGQKEIFSYSYSYFGLLLSATVFFLVLPMLFLWLINWYGDLKSLLTYSIPAILLLFLIYFFGHYYHYATHRHHFDPYLQMPPTKFDSISTHKSDSTFRVLCLGGSTTLNGRLQLTKRYPYLLHQLLAKQYPDKKIEVLNGGMDWYTTKHSIINYTT